MIDVDLDTNTIENRSTFQLLERPDDARPPELADGDADLRTPWYELTDHIHSEGDQVLGAHVRAESFVQAVEKALRLCFGKPID
jgi:hypothetical protein